jgi:tetratricopeptide (TPR) repeat protein
MKSGLSILDIILGFGFLIVFTLQYFLGDSSSYYVPLIFFFLIFIMMGIFEFRGYKIVYVLSAVLLIVMWIVSFIKPISPDVNETFYYIEIGLITLAISMLFVDSLKRLRKKKKALEPYDKALELDPNDIMSLNNKGVELSRQKRYKDAMECFDKIVEIDSEDVIVLNNKKVLEKFVKNRTLADYIADTPKLEVNEKNDKQILEIRK